MENVSRNAGGGIESLTTENVTLQAFLSLFPFLLCFFLGRVVLGGIRGMLLGFSQLLLRCIAGMHVFT